MQPIFRVYWALVGLMIPVVTHAQFSILTQEGGCDYVSGKIKAKCVPILIGHLVQVLFSLIGVFFLLNVIFAGYQMLIGAATGDGDGKGKDRLFHSIGGFVAAACAYLVVDLVITLAGA